MVAAGDGLRLGAVTRKAAVLLHGKPLVVWSLLAIARAPGLGGGVLVVHPDDREVARTAWLPAGEAESWSVCVGGATRARSVAAGLSRVPEDAGFVLVHDAARPITSAHA